MVQRQQIHRWFFLQPFSASEVKHFCIHKWINILQVQWRCMCSIHVLTLPKYSYDITSYLCLLQQLTMHNSSRPESISCGFLKQRKLLAAMTRGNNNKIIIVLFMIALAKYRCNMPYKLVNVCMFPHFSATTFDCVTFCNCFSVKKKKHPRIFLFWFNTSKQQWLFQRYKVIRGFGRAQKCICWMS